MHDSHSAFKPWLYINVGVLTGEMLVAAKAVLLLDEISTGLDSSTTFQICRCLATQAHLLGSTMLVSLLQPPPETYDLFDDIILLAEGAPHACLAGLLCHMLLTGRNVQTVVDQRSEQCPASVSGPSLLLCKSLLADLHVPSMTAQKPAQQESITCSSMTVPADLPDIHALALRVIGGCLQIKPEI